MVPATNPVTYPEPAHHGFPSPYGMALRESWESSPGGFEAQSLGYHQAREPQGSLRVASGWPQGGLKVPTGWLPESLRVASGWLRVAVNLLPGDRYRA